MKFITTGETMMYRLPDNSHTEDADLYVAEWRKMGDRLSDALDVRIFEFDPDFLIDNGENGRATVPVWLAQKIIALQTEIDDLHEY